MKVVKEVPFGLKVTCATCKTKYIAEADDVKMGDFGSALDDQSHYRLYVVCPSSTCGATHFIPWGKVPPAVEAAAHARSNR